ncbi:phage tail tape measure protein [Vibrio sp. TRT 17S01]|uniref:phage tail tape measure protein n=1 Tax=Vibrio sp. TRT 17S01 TaxID=3418505 RepID=UPI003CF07ABB
MAEKISFILDASVRGAKDIVATTSATERLTQAIVEQRTEIASINGKLKQVEGYQAAIKRMGKLKEQTRSAGDSVAKFSKQLDEQKAHTNQLRAAYSETQSDLKRLNTQLNKTSGEGAEKLKLKVKETELRLSALNSEIHESKVKTTDLNAAYKKATQRVTKLTDQQGKQRDKLRDLGATLKSAGLNTKRLGDEQRRLEQRSDKATAAIQRQNAHLKQMQAIQSRIDNRNAKLGELGGQATSLAMAAAPLGASVWTAVKNESSFADVKKVVDMSPEEAAQLRSWSLKTQANKDGGGLNSNSINAMLAAGGQSGIKNIDELKSFVLDSAAMGVAFDMGAGDAGETLATFKSALGLDQSGAMGLAGLANYLSNNSNAKARDIAGVMSRQGASAKLAGFSVNESAALSAAMLSTGMGEERTATALKNISGRLTLGDAATSSQKSALSAIGFSSSDLAASMQQDASGTLIEVLEAIKAAPLEEQSALLTQIFGEEAKGAVASLAENMGLFQKTLKLANQEQSIHTKSLQDEFNSRISTSENGIQRFINGLNRLSVIVGTAVLPALNWVLEPLGDAVMWLGDFAEANQELTAVVGIGAAAFIGLKGAILAGKAASLIFGNTLDKSRLFRKGLNKETQQSGRAAQFAEKQFSRLNRTLMNSGGGAGGSGGSARGGRSRRRRVRSRNPLARAYNFASGAFTGRKGALPLSLGAGALAMTPTVAMAQDAIDVTGDVADTLGKSGLSKVLRPLSMAISAGNIASALADGDTKGAITEGGGLLGGLGGASLGAALGTLILPGVGTVVGGIAGSLLGDMGGEMLAGWFSDKALGENHRLTPSSEVRETIAENQRKEAIARSMPPVKVDAPIQIHAAPGMDAQQIALEVKRQLEESLQMAGLSVSESLSVSSIDA